MRTARYMRSQLSRDPWTWEYVQAGGCVFPMVAFSIMPDAEFWPIYHRGDTSHLTDTTLGSWILGKKYINRPLVVFQSMYMNIQVFLLVLYTRHGDMILFRLLWLVYPFWAFRLGNRDLHFRPYSSFDPDYIPVADFRDDLLTHPMTHYFTT